MAGGQSTSYLRGVNATAFVKQENWASPDDVPDDVRAEFRRPDGRTSLWDEDRNGSRRNLIALALASQRKQIRTLRVAPFDSGDLPEELIARLLQTDGDTPLLEARSHHYELDDPRDEDYARFAMAIDKRFALVNYDTRSVADMLEDAIISKRMPLNSLNSDLRGEVVKLLSKRRISADNLRKKLAEHIIVDIRETQSPDQIPGAQWVDPRTLTETTLALPQGIAKRKPIVVYCSDGETSVHVARALRRSGYEIVRVLDGGYASW